MCGFLFCFVFFTIALDIASLTGGKSRFRLYKLTLSQLYKLLFSSEQPPLTGTPVLTKVELHPVLIFQEGSYKRKVCEDNISAYQLVTSNSNFTCSDPSAVRGWRIQRRGKKKNALEVSQN